MLNRIETYLKRQFRGMRFPIYQPTTQHQESSKLKQAQYLSFSLQIRKTRICDHALNVTVN